MLPHFPIRWAVCVAIVFALAVAPARGDARQDARALSAEEVRALVERAITNQHKDDDALAEYERRERRQARKHETDTEFSEDKTFRIVPTGTGTIKLVVEEKGQAVSPEMYRRQLRDVEQALVWALDPDESKQKRRVEKFEKRNRDRDEMVDAIRDAFQFTFQGRDHANGRTLVRVLFEPNPDFKSRSRNTDLFRHVRATVWIDETSAHLARIEAEIISDISVFGGVFGKIYRGGRFVLEQVPVAEGVWFPTRYEYNFSGRRFVFGFEMHEVTLATAYRRIGTPKEALAVIRRELNGGIPATGSR